MLQLATSADDRLLARRTPPFASARVRLDEYRWTPSFATQLNEWAATTTVLTILDHGTAMVSDRRMEQPFADQLRDGWKNAFRVVNSPRSVPALESCVVFQFAPCAAANALGAEPEPITCAPVMASELTRPLVQLGPAALFRYYWRRQSLALHYPASDAHVEDDALALLRYVVARSSPSRPSRSGEESVKPMRHRKLAIAAQALMRADVAALHPISHLARVLDASPFHLAHVFRAETGVSIHQYLMQLRLAAALDRLRLGAPDLSKLALELGFSHHSHFSAIFRQAIGWSPSEVRRMLTADSVSELGAGAQRCS